MPAPTTNGPINAVRCPRCGKTNDFRDMQSQQLLDTGVIVDCDACGGHMEVVAIRPITIVTVRAAQANNGVTRVHQPRVPPPRQATTLSPSQTRKLLGRR